MNNAGNNQSCERLISLLSIFGEHLPGAVVTPSDTSSEVHNTTHTVAVSSA